MKVRFGLTEQLRQDVFVQTGQQLPSQTTIDVPTTEFTPDERRFLLRFQGHAAEEVTLKIPGTLYVSNIQASVLFANNDQIWESSSLPLASDDIHQLLTGYSAAYVERVQDNDRFRQEALKQYIQKLEAQLADPEPIRGYPQSALKYYKDCEGYDRAEALFLQLEARYKAQEEEKEQQAREKSRQEKERKEQIERDKTEWIGQYASASLRKKFEAGYNCQRDYAFERAHAEHPEYLLDYNDDASYKDRSCPSDAAFAEAERVGGEVVYLTKLPSTAPEWQDEYYDFDECEAVVIHEYLGKYDLIRAFF